MPDPDTNTHIVQPEDIGGPYAYQDALISQFSWIQETLSNILESIENREVPDLDLDSAPWWYLKHRSEVFDKKKMNQALAKLYQKKGDGKLNTGSSVVGNTTFQLF